VQDGGALLNYLLAGLWPYVRAMIERSIKDAVRSDIVAGPARIKVETVSLGEILPLVAHGERGNAGSWAFCFGPRCMGD
jgi:hypothetical protein